MTRMQEYMCGNGHRFDYLVHNIDTPEEIVCPKCRPNLHTEHVRKLDAGCPSNLTSAFAGSPVLGRKVISATLPKTIVRGNGDFAEREKARLTRRADEHNLTKDAIEETVETGREIMRKASGRLE